MGALRDALFFDELGYEVQCLLCLLAHSVLALHGTNRNARLSQVALEVGVLDRPILKLTISGILEDMMETKLI